MKPTARHTVSSRRSTSVPLVALVTTWACTSSIASAKVQVQGDRLVRDGVAFIVKGIDYSPWGPGTGPGQGDWPSQERIVADLRMIEQMGCNTVSVVQPPERFFAAVKRTDLLVCVTLSVFQVQWESFGSQEFKDQEAAFMGLFERHKDNEQVFLWLLGREITPRAVELHGDEILGWMKRSADSMHTDAPNALVSHGNWPPVRSLDMGFLDLTWAQA